MVSKQNKTIHLLTCPYLKLPVRSDAPGLSSTCVTKFAPRLKRNNYYKKVILYHKINYT